MSLLQDIVLGERKQSTGGWQTGQFKPLLPGVLTSPLTYSHLNFSFLHLFPDFDKLRKGADVTAFVMRRNLYFTSNSLDKWPSLSISELFSDLEDLILEELPEHLCIQALTSVFSETTRLLNCELTKCSLKRVDPSIFKWTKLQHLNLSRNNLHRLPKELFTSLPNLVQLNVSQNNIKKLSKRILLLKELTSINLSCNPIGYFPKELVNLPMLREIYLWNCNILYLPEELFNIDIGNEILSPRGDPNTIEWIKLDIHSNQITSFPLSWCTLVKLEYLDISCNNISYLPASFGYLRSLTYLNVRANHLILLPPALARIQMQLKYLFICQNKFSIPPPSFIGPTLNYYAGILPGQYHDPWILQSITRCLTFRQWNSPELIAIGHSVSGELFRRHIDKAMGDCGEPISPISLKCLLLNSYDKQVILTALNDLSTSYGTDIYSEGAVPIILSLTESRDKEIALQSTRVLANLCITNNEAAIEILKNSPKSQKFLEKVKVLIQERNIDYLRCFLSLCCQGHAKFHRIIQPDEIEYGKELGKGATGVVYRGKWNGKDVAVKKLNPEVVDVKEFRTELAVMSILDHPGIVHCYGGYEKKRKEYFIVCKLYESGNLSELLHNEDNQNRLQIPFETCVKIVSSVAKAIAYIHDMNIIHRDMKAENLLVDENFNVCVADLGISCLRARRQSKGMGTPKYMAPELLEGKSYTEKVDVFSFGILCWEILTKQIVYEQEEFTSWEISEKVVGGYRPKLPAEWPPVIASIVMACWNQEPSKRPTMNHVCSVLKPLEGKSYEEMKCIQPKQKALSKFLVHSSSVVSSPSQVFKQAAQAAKSKKKELKKKDKEKRGRQPSFKKLGHSLLSPQRRT